MTARADCECYMKGSGEEARGGKATQISPAQKMPGFLQEPKRRCKVSSLQRDFCREESLSGHGICHGCTETVCGKSSHNLKVIVMNLKCLQNIQTSRKF